MAILLVILRAMTARTMLIDVGSENVLSAGDENPARFIKATANCIARRLHVENALISLVYQPSPARNRAWHHSPASPG